MSNWLFTNKPSEYRLIDALKSGVAEIEWLVTRYAREMRRGDRVFLWQMKGNEPRGWGLHAVGELISEPRKVSDDYLDEFWTSSAAKRLDLPRVRVRIDETAPPGKHVQKQIVERDPVLSTLPNLRFAQAANFKLDDKQARALLEVWSQTAISLNAPSRSMTEVSEPVDLETRFDDTARDHLDRAVKPLLGKSLSDLLEMLRMRGRKDQTALPPKIKVAGAIRDPIVIAFAKVRADHRCEVPGCTHETFETPDGLPYVEVHHIHHLAKGGPDSVENTACVCASHHREIHFGKRQKLIETQLKSLRR